MTVLSKLRIGRKRVKCMGKGKEISGIRCQVIGRGSKKEGSAWSHCAS